MCLVWFGHLDIDAFRLKTCFPKIFEIQFKFQCECECEFQDLNHNGHHMTEYTRNWNTGKYIGQWNDNEYSFNDGIESIWAFPLHDSNVVSCIYFPANLLLFWNIQIEYFVCPMMNVLNKMCVFLVCVDNQFDKTFENVCLWKSKSIITGVLHCAILADCSVGEMRVKRFIQVLTNEKMHWLCRLLWFVCTKYTNCILYV